MSARRPDDDAPPPVWRSGSGRLFIGHRIPLREDCVGGAGCSAHDPVPTHVCLRWLSTVGICPRLGPSSRGPAHAFDCGRARCSLCVSHSVWSCGNRFGCQVAQHLKSSTRARPESWTPARASKPERAKELSASLVRRFVRLLDDNRREPNVTLALRLTIICSVTLMALAGSLSSVDKSKSSYGRARLADRAI
jgi:hypothetical protein